MLVVEGEYSPVELISSSQLISVVFFNTKSLLPARCDPCEVHSLQVTQCSRTYTRPMSQ